MNLDHLIIDLNDDGKWKCLHCGESYKMNLPAPIKMVQVAQECFLEMHKDCEDKHDTRTSAPD